MAKDDSGLKGWFARGQELVTDAALAGIRELVKDFEGEVDIDVARQRMMVSDALLGRLVRQGARAADGVEVLDFQWDGTAYLCRVRTAERTLSARLRPDSVKWADGVIELIASTPEPPTIEDAPAATWLLARFVGLFGGGAVGGYVLSRGAPEGLRWDGDTVTWRRPLPVPLGEVDPLLPLVGITLIARLSHDARGLWLAFEGGMSAYLTVLSWLLRLWRGW
ncbi:MAG: hypothetical protein IPN17_29975 [Deltaproteobacteria bacterium]|nr:hypothetical protein [Deltaproteobacteria bacterium]MBK8696384.1 hypothetical protein [Deltaproteobacteria bacterium]